MRIIQFAAKNALLMNLITVMILGFGIYEVSQMRREAFPAIAIDYVWVTTYYPGAGPKEVERYVTHPLEREIEKISGIKQIDSSSIEGISKITIELETDRSDLQKDRTTTDIQRAVDQATDLPDDLPDPPRVTRLDSAENSILDVALGGDLPFDQLYALGERYQDRIETLDDVAKLDWRAERDREFWVEVDPDAMVRYQIGFDQIMRALAQQNVNLPAGSLQEPTGELLLRSVGELRTTDDIEKVVVAATGGGPSILVGDVARARRAFSKETIHLRANGDRVILFSAKINTSKGDIIRAIDKIKAQTDDFLREVDAPELQVTYINDMSEFVYERLSVLLSNGLLGIVLVLAVLLLLLSKGIAFITALGMPIAFVGALLAMIFGGMTINLITMFAMILVIGMLVDDAIIVAENIWQHYENGESAWDATIKGASEVFWPVTATILTTIAAFSPMLMVSGIFGEFIRWLPITVMVMLGISLVEAMLILPAHAHDVLKFKDRQKARQLARGKKIKEGESRLVTAILDRYVAWLSAILRWRYAFIVLIFGLFGFSAYWSQGHMHLELFPNDEMDAFFVRAKLPISATMEETTETFKHIEAMIVELPDHELEDYMSYIGLIQNDPGDPFTENGSNIGQIAVYLTPLNDRDRTAFEIMDAIREQMPALADKLGLTTWNLDMVRSGPPVGKPIAIQLKGDDYDVLLALAHQVTQMVEAVDGTKDVVMDYSRGKDELQIEIDNAAAARALLTPEDISRQILIAYEGGIATHIRDIGERTPVRVKYQESAATRLEQLRQMQIANARGHMIPLNDVATFKTMPGVRQLLHRDGFRSIGITANIKEGETDSTTVNQTLEPKINALLADYPGVFAKLGGEYEETSESMDSLARAFVVALGLIFLILATQFKSITQPFVVMTAIPFGIIGMVWSFYFHGLPISFVGLIGMIGLSGVIINDSIVLIDFVNKARVNGMSAMEACLYAGRRRFRAVWLTTATTVTGLMPMIYGVGGMDRFMRPAAITMGYGLIFGTVLILFFVPALYLVRDDLAGLLGSVVRRGQRTA